MQVGSSLKKMVFLAETPKLVIDVGGYHLGSGSSSQLGKMSFADFKSWILLRRSRSLPRSPLVHTYAGQCSGKSLKRESCRSESPEA